MNERVERLWFRAGAACLAMGGMAAFAVAQEPPQSAPVTAPAAVASDSPDAAGPAAATKPITKRTAQMDAGEPRAQTSLATDGPSAEGAAAVPQAPAAGPPARGAGKAVGGRTPSAGSKAASTADRVDLGTATVTGDREQPKVMYIVPWKKSDIGDLSGKPMNSLLDEALAPVDRDVFKREVAYYDAVRADASQNSPSGSKEAQGEK